LTSEGFYFNPPVTGFANVYNGTIEEMERKMILHILQKSGQNLSASAEQLGITRQTLYNKMKKYNL